ncbi:hypothetical protein [Parasitella parasitica]|uniref:Fork-head domain-containing protein n=1 Tax=Parasitella parasitica TaxID=35722 RepID=A0A0B7MPM7_9FUNG|nr:hypothetical protein [Parasitella parasitica]
MSDYCLQSNKMSPTAQGSRQQKKRHQQKKSSELKFKMESVGIHPEDDDDLDMCPARTRPSWPKKIIPWWVASDPNEKPPYSYATLIAHAILSSKDGRLTLNDIYQWISQKYPVFSMGNGGWQNSIRHNLSLNKKWFYKIDRRPTQANPGKGCYWALIAGTEQIFIDNLTQEGGNSRKHHDIGLAVELSTGQRRGACFYNNFNNSATPAISASASNLNNAAKPLYTTFRMKDLTPKSEEANSTVPADDSDNDSGVDVSNQYVMDSKKHLKKRRRTNTGAVATLAPTTSTVTSAVTTAAMTLDMGQLHVNNNQLQNIVYETPASTCISSFDDINYDINSWVEQCLTYTDQQAQPQLQHHTPWKRQNPITVHLDNEVTQKYLHFADKNVANISGNLMLTAPSNPAADLTFENINLSQSLPHQPSCSSFNMLLQPQYQLSQFVSMQDVLYSKRTC